MIMTMRRGLVLLIVLSGLMWTSMATAASRPSGPAPELVAVQVSLYVLGYNPGPIDGLGGPRTIAALTAYAEDRSIVLNQATLNLTLELLHLDTVEELRSAAGEEGSKTSSEPRLLPTQQW
jgi:peptidoglycan hydrolase-like protein with peptidoglycan-binding domain